MTTVMQVWAYIITWTLFPLGIVSSLVRIYCCSYVTRTWKPDDYMGITVGVTLIGAVAFWQTGLTLGCGGKEPNKCNYFDPGGDLVRYLYILPIYYTAMHFLIKNAFLAYYLRLSPNRTFRLWVGVGFGLNFGAFMAGLLILVFQCIPVSAALNTLARLKAQCMDRYFMLFAPAAINILLDIYVFVLPIPTLARLQMPRRKKLGVISVFLFGAGSVIMGILRFHSVLKLLDISNTSRGVGEIIIVVALELNLAAIAVNLPAIRSIWVKKAKDRASASLSNDQYSSKSRKGLSTNNTIGSARPRATHEKTQLSSPVRDLPLSDSQEKLWRNIESADGDVPCQHKTISRHEQFTSVEL